MTKPEGQEGTALSAEWWVLQETAGHCSFASTPGHAVSRGAIFVACEGEECLHGRSIFPLCLSLYPKIVRKIPKIQNVFSQNQDPGLVIHEPKIIAAGDIRKG